MRLIAILLLVSVLYAEDLKPATPPPTVEQQLAAKAAQIKWLTERVAIVQAQAKAITEYYAATEALRQSDAAKPAEPKPAPEIKH